MAAKFNADEVFEIACQIERNGARFYRRAAECELEQDASEVLQRLAAMEDQHLRVFRRLRSRLSADAPRDWAFDFRDEAEQYLHAVADAKVFDSSDPTEKLTGEESAAEVIDMAIGIEKDSVVFYTGIRSGMSDELGGQEVDAIIRQELAHVASLSGLAARLKE
jgi:rubrerythrin